MKKAMEKGRTWRTPEEVVRRNRISVKIVGRGILKAKDRFEKAERYKKAAWAACNGRIRE